VYLLFLHLLLPLLTWLSPADTNMCNHPNNAYNVGEKIRYTIYYNVVGLYVNAGRTDFSVTSTNFNGQDAYSLTALGKSNSKYDWIFKVRDKYESIVDTKTLLPYQFTRNINEGSFHHKEQVVFNQKTKTAITNGNAYSTADCTYDVVSAIYAARNINYANLQPNDKVYLNFFLDKDLYPSYFKFLGRSVITTQYGKFKVIKLAPLLVKGTMFKDGDKMVVWVTDDENHIPVRIETPIVVGSIKVDLVGYENLRHPLSSLIELVVNEDNK
jgi:hypothetical protein